MDVLVPASTLLLVQYSSVFQDFLISEVTLENCVDIGHIANAYNLSRVDHHVNVFMLQNFNLVNDFNKVPYERLRFLMSSNNLKVGDCEF